MATTTTSKKRTTKTNPKAKKTTKKSTKKTATITRERKPKNIKLIILVILLLGILLIFSTYAWFSTSLNVKVKTFNMIVTRNTGLTMSFDAVNYDMFLDISRKIIIDDVKVEYPNHRNQWAANGLIPVSSPGLPNSNTYFFDFFGSNGVVYKNRLKDVGYIRTEEVDDSAPRSFNSYIAFDIFLKNESGSPVPDRLYFKNDTFIQFDTKDGELSEEMQGLLNSVRLAIVKVASVPLGTNPTTIQNLTCNNDCNAIIYEPYRLNHTELSKERAKKYGIHLEDGTYFPTYAYKRAGGLYKLADTVSGAANMDMEIFSLQQTISEEDFDTPLFEVPTGITKARIYLWIEGQDIDSLETHSQGANLDISISLVKDTYGYDVFD